MADKPEKSKSEIPPVVVKAERAMSRAGKWLHYIEDILEGVGIFGGLAALFGMTRTGKKSSTSEDSHERSGPASLRDEFFLLIALFGNVQDRVIKGDDIGRYLQILEKARLSRFQRSKLEDLIGYEVERGAQEKGAAKVAEETNPMGRKIIIGLIDLGEDRAVELLTKTSLLDNPVDTIRLWYGIAKKWVEDGKNIPAWLQTGIAKVDQAILKYLGARDKADAQRIVAARQQELQRRKAIGWARRDREHHPKTMWWTSVLIFGSIGFLIYLLN